MADDFELQPIWGTRRRPRFAVTADPAWRGVNSELGANEPPNS